jgi:hypothetical protein
MVVAQTQRLTFVAGAFNDNRCGYSTFDFVGTVDATGTTYSGSMPSTCQTRVPFVATSRRCRNLLLGAKTCAPQRYSSRYGSGLVTRRQLTGDECCAVCAGDTSCAEFEYDAATQSCSILSEQSLYVARSDSPLNVVGEAPFRTVCNSCWNDVTSTCVACPTTTKTTTTKATATTKTTSRPSTGTTTKTTASSTKPSPFTQFGTTTTTTTTTTTIIATTEILDAPTTTEASATTTSMTASTTTATTTLDPFVQSTRFPLADACPGLAPPSPNPSPSLRFPTPTPPRFFPTPQPTPYRGFSPPPPLDSYLIQNGGLFGLGVASTVYVVLGVMCFCICYCLCMCAVCGGRRRTTPNTTCNVYRCSCFSGLFLITILIDCVDAAANDRYQSARYDSARSSARYTPPGSYIQQPKPAVQPAFVPVIVQATPVTTTQVSRTQLDITRNKLCFFYTRYLSLQHPLR